MIFVYFVSILAGISSGVTESINKSITEKKYSSFSYFFLQLSLNGLLFLIPFLLFGSFPKLSIVYLYIFLAVLATFLGNLSLIKAYKTEDISNITILLQSSLLVTFTSGIVFLHEKINMINIVGFLAIICGILIIFYEGKKLRLSFGLFLALVVGLSFGISAVFQKLALSLVDPLSFVFIFDFFIVSILLFIPKTYKDIKTIFGKYKKKIILSRFTAVSAFYLLLWTYQRSKIAVANVNFTTVFLLSSVLIGILFLGERKNISKKLAGSLLCVLGIILLNFF
ncbi:DMT family transporter [Candidatus Gottesmanbacteria bacterium]|nr:DMT family transporter [Candidatus Gottesmanbacteria bacterium]